MTPRGNVAVDESRAFPEGFGECLGCEAAQTETFFALRGDASAHLVLHRMLGKPDKASVPSVANAYGLRGERSPDVELDFIYTLCPECAGKVKAKVYEAKPGGTIPVVTPNWPEGGENDA